MYIVRTLTRPLSRQMKVIFLYVKHPHILKQLWQLCMMKVEGFITNIHYVAIRSSTYGYI